MSNIPERTPWRRNVKSNKPTKANFCNAFSSFQNILKVQSIFRTQKKKEGVLDLGYKL